MLRSHILLLALLLLLKSATLPDGPAYTPDGQLKYPAGYSEWVFLGTGLDMSYNPEAKPADHSVFNSVYANPSAYKAFKQTGHWPEGTMLVLENRAATAAASINTRGKTESSEIVGTEVHVKDSTRNPGDGWAFFNFKDKVSGQLIPRPADCYSCHEQHAAVDTTFVQFYPFALDIAKQKGTLSPSYRKDSQPPN